MSERKSVDLAWILRPQQGGDLARYDGRRVHSVSRAHNSGDGRVEVVLADGEHLRVHPTDLRAEQPRSTDAP